MKVFGCCFSMMVAMVVFARPIAAELVAAETRADVTEPKAVLATMQKVADWQLANPGKHRCWVRGTFYTGVMALGRMEGGCPQPPRASGRPKGG